MSEENRTSENREKHEKHEKRSGRAPREDRGGRNDRRRSRRPRRRGGEGGERRERAPRTPLREDVPLSEAFAALGLSDRTLKAVFDLGYELPTPVQEQAIPEVLAGRDLLAAAQTGTGKTAAFLLPAMDRIGKGGKGCHPSILVVTPTRELAQQIDEHARTISRRTGHHTLTVVGGVSYGPQRKALQRGVDVLVATPGRLVDLINQGSAHLDCVQTLVLDEADRMLDMGFLPDVRKIVDLTPVERQTLLFSATLDDKAIGSIKDLVSDPARVEIVPEHTAAETVEQYVLPVSPNMKNRVLEQLLDGNGAEHTIVFVRTKRRADACVERLRDAGFSAEAIHGDRSQAQRQRALRSFRAGKVDVIVATDVLARGIDVQGVRYVVNFDIPEEQEDYIHRIGRTGRAGETGWAVTIVTNQDLRDFYAIEKMMDKAAELYDADGIDVGDEAPFIDPDRVPAEFDPSARSRSKGRGGRSGRGGNRPGSRRRGERKRREDGQDRRRSGDHGEEPAAEKRSRRVRDEREAPQAEKSERLDRRREDEDRGGRGYEGRGSGRDGRAGRRGGARNDRSRRSSDRPRRDDGYHGGNRASRRGGAGKDEPFYSRVARSGKRRPGDHGGRR